MVGELVDFNSVIGWITTVVCRCVYLFLWIPFNIQLHFRRQGISGPPLRLPFGNAREIVRFMKEAQAKPLPAFHHDFVGRVLPHYTHWTSSYGKCCLFWFGTQPMLAIPKPELIREVLLNPKGDFEKPEFNPLSRRLIGDGLFGLRGKKRLRHKRIILPAFHKTRWVKEAGEGPKEVDAFQEFHVLAADINSRTAFGSNYEEGKRIFSLQEEQTTLVLQALRSVYIPGFRFIPTQKNRERWRIEREIRSLLRVLIAGKKEELKEKSMNLLGLMLSANDKEKEEQRMSTEEIVDECKTFYFVGNETTANFLTWTVLLLALHKEWQSKARDEVLSVFGRHGHIDAESLGQLKIVEMVLKESLRLYPPAVFLLREVCKDTKLGDLTLPAGVEVYLPILAVHHDANLWGPDVSEFNPGRFYNGSSDPTAFFPFGMGSRVCIGQNLAMTEGRVVISMILQQFYLDVAPTYVHAPMPMMTLQPQYGAQVFHFRRLGIAGPPLRLPFGNAREIVRFMKEAQGKPLPAFHHDFVGRVLPHYIHWTSLYGKCCLFWFGTQPRLAIPKPELIREVLLNPKGDFERPEFNPLSRRLIGDGLVGLRGKKWLRHKRIILPAFHGMVSAMVASTEVMLERWVKETGEGPKEVDAFQEFHVLAADIISRTAFGSNYEEGKRIFSLQEEQTTLVLQALRSVYIPSFRTEKGGELSLLRVLIAGKKEELKEKSMNLLGLMLSAIDKEREEQRMSTEEIVDECKTFYFAGKETTANFLTWTVLLLALHKEWQSKARDEVLSVFGRHGHIDAESLGQLKIVEMVLKESLRLYPPAVFLRREVCKDTKLGDLTLPAGVEVFLPILAVHHDADLWGPDVSEFNPTRFSNGSSNPAAFFPFGMGSRVCIGQNLAMTEGRVVISMILQQFFLDVAPTYVHAPMPMMTLQPQYGAQVLHFRRQGISGPPLRLPFGNAREIVRFMKEAQAKPLPAFHHDFVGRVLPHYIHWTSLYGKCCLFWFGTQPRLAIPKPELIREVLLNPKGDFERPEFNPLSRQLIGDGLVGLRGKKWLRHKRIILPAFHARGGGRVHELGRSSSAIVECTGWSGRNLSRSSRSVVFFVKLFFWPALRSVYVPGSRFLPTQKNRERWRTESEIKSLLRVLIAGKQEELEEKSTNLLGLMLSANNEEREEKTMSMEEIVDECKTFYFAGKEATAAFLTWTVLLLASHKEWQSKARDEVLSVLGRHGHPVAESLDQLKIVSLRFCSSTQYPLGCHIVLQFLIVPKNVAVMKQVEMVLKESLRLYPPAVHLHRQACKDMKLGDLTLPAGVQVYLPILAVHHNAEFWGPDVSEFNPARFSDGSSNPAAFFPFAMGPRVCIGKNLVMTEGRVVISMILQQFSLDVSPTYVHAPMQLMALQPQYGAQVILHRMS
ncbi:Cytochrome P450 734A1 [Nymphaea thermarum]|nr:Cytochrome P450 734A1 [Nymphaea thermarum]